MFSSRSVDSLSDSECDPKVVWLKHKCSSQSTFPTGKTQDMHFDYNLQPPSQRPISVHNTLRSESTLSLFWSRRYCLRLHTRLICWLFRFHSYPAMSHCLHLCFSRVLKAFLFWWLFALTSAGHLSICYQ